MISIGHVDISRLAGAGKKTKHMATKKAVFILVKLKRCSENIEDRRLKKFILAARKPLGTHFMFSHFFDFVVYTFFLKKIVG